MKHQGAAQMSELVIVSERVASPLQIVKLRLVTMLAAGQQEGTEFVLVFDDGNFSENQTLLITEVMAHLPRSVVAKNFSVPEAAFKDLPTEEKYIFRMPVPAALDTVRKQLPNDPPPLPYVFHASKVAPNKFDGGSTKVVDRRQFPETSLAALIIDLEPDAMREIHWHPDADELQYYIKGEARMTVFDATRNADVQLSHDWTRKLKDSGRSKRPLSIVIVSSDLRVRSPVEARETVLRVGSLELDLIDRTARRGSRPIDLRPREFQLLKYMMQRSDQVLSRANLLKDVWHYKFVPETNVVDVHMGRLRCKVDGPNEAPMIRNVRGEGFVLSETSTLKNLPGLRAARADSNGF
jgi:DNA-binding winged helix-turn-helix (wHTH) protein